MSTPATLRRTKTTAADLRAMYKNPTSLSGAAPDPPLDGAFLSALKQAAEPLGIWKGLDALNTQARADHQVRFAPRLSQNWRRTQAPALHTVQQNAASITTEMARVNQALVDLRMHEHVIAAAALSQGRVEHLDKYVGLRVSPWSIRS